MPFTAFLFALRALPGTPFLAHARPCSAFRRKLCMVPSFGRVLPASLLLILPRATTFHTGEGFGDPVTLPSSVQSSGMGVGKCHPWWGDEFVHASTDLFCQADSWENTSTFVWRCTSEMQYRLRREILPSSGGACDPLLGMTRAVCFACDAARYCRDCTSFGR